MRGRNGGTRGITLEQVVGLGVVRLQWREIAVRMSVLVIVGTQTPPAPTIHAHVSFNTHTLPLPGHKFV